jgi:hypothetical protein
LKKGKEMNPDSERGNRKRWNFGVTLRREAESRKGESGPGSEGRMLDFNRCPDCTRNGSPHPVLNAF